MNREITLINSVGEIEKCEEKFPVFGMPRCFVAFLSLLLVSLVASDAVNTTNPYRLPSASYPEHYDVWIQLNEITFPFSLTGQVSIDIQLLEASNSITLHCHNLTIATASLTINGNPFSSFSNVYYLEEEQMAIISFSDTLPIGSITITIQYTGYITTSSAKGFFVSPLEVLAPSSIQERPMDYENQLLDIPNWMDGPVMFATQFEGPYARTAFPCYDEPGLKATFTISLSVPISENLTVLSNTPQVGSFNDSSYDRFYFAVTPVPISCYLIAFAIGTFDHVSVKNNGIEYSVYTPPGKAAYGEFALGITVELMNYWTDLWDFPFPFPKLDQISVPRIVQDGMENIGLITYWPGYLLAIPEVWTVAHYQKNCMVISHELSHLWFGDTVTMPWWSETYNNEGFARYLQYTGCNAIFPEWNTFEDGSFNFFDFAYSIIKQDSLGTLHAEVVAPDAVSGTVDSISNAFAGPTYPKGASLNRMFNIYMGDDDWNGALSYHLHKYEFTNPTTGDLLDSFDEYTNNTMQLREKFMPWLTLPGFPIVTVDMHDGFITAHQAPCSRYLPENGQDYEWFITLPLSLNGTTSNEILLNFSSSNSPSIPIGSASNDFVIGNMEHTSYFVVNYASMAQWNSVFDLMANPDYDSVFRNLLAQDVFILSQMSHQSLSLPLNMTASWSPLASDVIWNYILPLWFDLTVAVDNQSYYPSLQQELVSYLEPVIEKIPSLPSQSQSTLLFYASLYGDMNVIQENLDDFHNGVSFPLGSQKAGFWSVGRYGTEDDYNALTTMYSTSSSKKEQSNLLLGLTGPQNVHLCNVTLTLFDDELEISDRLAQARNMLAYNPFCRNLAWDYVRVTGVQMFKQQGSAAASAFLSSFSGLLSTSYYFGEASRFMTELQKQGWLTEQEVMDSLTLIDINIDINNLNSERK